MDVIKQYKQEPIADLFVEVKTEVENLQLLLSEYHEEIKEESNHLASQGFVTANVENLKDEPEEELEESFIEANSNICYNDSSDSTKIKKETETDEKARILFTECDLPTVKSEDINTFANHYSKKSYSSSYSRLKHFNANFGKHWQACEFCGHFYNKFKYFGHYFIHSVKTNATKLLNGNTNKPSSLKKHMKSTEWKTRSKHERNRFVGKNSKAYTGQRAFKCEICFKEFTQKNTLKVHLKIHTGEKPYKCNICSKQFIQKIGLNNHIKFHTGDKPFKCNTCSKQFTHKGHLNKHLKIHTGEKPYTCNICSKKFTQKNSLDWHLKIHTGEKPYICEICSKQFLQKTGLNYHLRIHTGEKPFKCKTCLKEFAQKSHFNRHLKIHNGKNHINVIYVQNDIHKKQA